MDEPAPGASPWIALVSGSVVLVIVGLVAAINGSWRFLAFFALVTTAVGWQLAAVAAERRGAVSTAQRRVLRHVGAIVFAVAAVVLGRIIGSG